MCAKPQEQGETDLITFGAGSRSRTDPEVDARLPGLLRLTHLGSGGHAWPAGSRVRGDVIPGRRRALVSMRDERS